MLDQGPWRTLQRILAEESGPGRSKREEHLNEEHLSESQGSLYWLGSPDREAVIDPTASAVCVPPEL